MMRFRQFSVLLASIFLFFAIPVATQAATQNFTVNNANDSGAGSLRQAIIDCNAVAPGDDCAISLENSASRPTLSLATTLPSISKKAVFQNGGVEADLIISPGTSLAAALTFVSGSAGSVLEGLAFTGGYTSAAIVVASTATDIQIGNTASAGDRITIYGSGRGIQVAGDDVTIQHVIIGQDLDGVANGPTDNGIEVTSAAATVVIDTVTITNAGGPSISLDSSTDVTISNSSITGGSSFGIGITGVTNAIITGNTISGHSGVVLRVSGGSGVVITGNTLSSTAQTILSVIGSPASSRFGAATLGALATEGNIISGSSAVQAKIYMATATPSGFAVGYNDFGSVGSTTYVRYDTGFAPFAAASGLSATSTTVSGTAGVSSGTVFVYQNGVLIGSKSLSDTSFSLSGGDFTSSPVSGSTLTVLVQNSSSVPTNTATVLVFDGAISSPTITPTTTSLQFAFTSTETLTPYLYVATTEEGLDVAVAVGGTLGTSHSLTKTLLTSNREYFYRIDTVSSTGAVTRSAVRSGATRTTFSGAISSVTETPTHTNVALAFTSTETLLPKVYVATTEEGLAGATPVNGVLGTSHSITVSSLTASTVYYYRIDRVNAVDETIVGSVDSFSTTATPDVTAPVLQSFTTSATNGRYGPGATIAITATYNETINALSTMQITLNNSALINLTGVGSTATLTGTYTVPPTGSGGGTSDLTVSTINAESVVDLAPSPNTRTNSSVPSGSNNIGGSKDLVVDTTAPTVSEVTPVTTPTNDSTPNYTFTTNEAGTIAFTMGSCRSVTTSASSGSNTITLDSNGSGGALPDGSYANCRLTVTDVVNFGSSNVSSALSILSFTIATTAPPFESFVTITSSGTYTTGEQLALGAKFTQAVTADSSLTVRLTNGVEVLLVYNSEFGNEVLLGTYTVGGIGDGEDDADLQVASIVSYSISDALGNATTTPPSIVGATRFFNPFASAIAEFVIDTGEVPTITSISSDTINGSYNVGDVIDIDVTFSESVTSTGNVTITLETGAIDQTCTFTVSGARTGTCNYTVQAGDMTTDLDATISGTLVDFTGNAVVSFTPETSLATNKNIVIDTTTPTDAPDTTDTTAPAAPVIVTSNGGNTSIVTSAGIVKSKTPTFQGTAEALSTVIVRDSNGNALCTTTTNSDSAWSCASTVSLALGSQTVNVTAMDAAGNVSPATSVTFTRSSINASYTIKQTLITPKAKKGKYPAVKKGKTVKYAVKIKNTGEANLTKLKLTQTYPTKTLKFKKGTVKPNSTKKKGTVVWNNVLKNKPLKPGATRTITVSYTVKAIPVKKAARTLTVATKATGGKDAYNLTARNRTTKNKKLKVRFSIQDARFQSFIRFGNGGSSAQYSPKVQSTSLARGQTLLKFEDGTDNDFNDFQLILSYKTATEQFEFIPVNSSANLDHMLYFRFVVNGKANDIPIFQSTQRLAQTTQSTAVAQDVTSLLQ
jgi:hypothetical protein